MVIGSVLGNDPTQHKVTMHPGVASEKDHQKKTEIQTLDVPKLGACATTELCRS